MDMRARLALEDLARRAVAADLDQVVAEVDRLRRELTALRHAAGLPAGRELDRLDRRARAIELRAEGHSTRSIAAALGADRNTVSRDLAGVPRPPAIRGLDGRVTAGPPPPAA